MWCTSTRGEGFDLRVGPLEEGGARPWCRTPTFPSWDPWWSAWRTTCASRRHDEDSTASTSCCGWPRARLAETLSADLGGVVHHLQLASAPVSSKTRATRRPPLHQHHPIAVAALTLVEAQQQPQPARVEERDLAEVEDQQGRARRRARARGASKFLDRGQVDLARQRGIGAVRGFERSTSKRFTGPAFVHHAGSSATAGAQNRVIRVGAGPPGLRKVHHHRPILLSRSRTREQGETSRPRRAGPRGAGSRAQFLKMVGGAGAAGALAIFVAACGDDDDDSGSRAAQRLQEH